MIKVLHISTFHLSGGAALAAARLNRAQNKSGMQSLLLTARSSAVEPAVRALDGTFSGKALFWMNFLGERLFFLLHEKNKEIRYRFSPAVTGRDLADNPLVKESDVIHLHWVNFGLLSISSVQKLLDLGKPVVWTLHDMWTFTGGCHYSGDCRGYVRDCGNCVFLRNPGVHDLSYRRLLLKKQLWTSASRLVAVACSRWLEREAKSSSLLGAFHVTNIPNPIDTDVFTPLGKKTACELLGLAEDKDYLLFAAASVTSSLKGFAFLKEALRRLVEHSPVIAKRLELLVIGNGAPGILDEIPLKAHFLGFVKGDENLARVYSAASLYITPSVEDNLPNTLMEALACGTPAVGFRTGGIPEMIEHKKNGFVADYKSPESLEEGIIWVIEHNSDGGLSRSAREKALHEYAEKVVGERYRKLYESMMTD